VFRLLSLLLGALVFAGALFAVGLRWIETEIDRPGPTTSAKVIYIPRGLGSDAIGQQLVDEDLIEKPWLLMAAQQFRRDPRALRAGEYEIAAGASLAAILEQLRAGRTIVRRLTVPEGLTSSQILDLIRRADGLDGATQAILPEGSLLPETYHYQKGDRRADLVKRLQTAMTAALAEAWNNRNLSVPLRTPEELLVLASIVEKETGLAAERERVAGVFINRLRKNMRLQSDPTVLYGVVGGGARSLTRADLDTDTPWNTYTRAGLPASPITNPGRAALMAAAKPLTTDDLYFVADGTGGHAFAKTLDEHNRNVAKWRQIEKTRAARP
jgi:UPF0755 protein